MREVRKGDLLKDIATKKEPVSHIKSVILTIPCIGQLRLIQLLSGNVNYTIDEIGEKLNLSRRTIYRYIDTFRSAGFAVMRVDEALWIAEAQMMQETDEIVGFTNIHEGNALRMDWNEVVPAAELNYIMGNPPFIVQIRRL